MAMTADTMKMFGFGEYPDWRWRCAMRNIEHTLDANTAAEYFTGPGEEALLEDEALVDFVFPCLKWSLHPDFDTGMSDGLMTVVKLAIRAGNEERITPNSDSLNFEVGILSRRPLDDPLIQPCDSTQLIQMVYERLFFDVRPFLNDPAAVCRLLFRDRERLRHRGGFDLASKITAYCLGFDEYRSWREGSPSDSVKALHRAVNSTFRYVDGLPLLGVGRPDDMEKAFGFLFSVLPDILVRGNGNDGGKRGWHDYSDEEMDDISEMLHWFESVAG